MSQKASASGPRRESRDALEWLYIMFTAGGLLVALALVILTFFVTGRLSQQAQTLSQMSERVAALETKVAARPEANAGERKQSSSGANPASKLREPAAAQRPTATTRTAAAQAPPIAESFKLTDAEIGKQYEELVGEEAEGELGVRDAVEARVLLELAAEDDARNVERGGLAWGRLAMVALLTGDADRAERYASRAEAVGQTLMEYWESAARRSLEADKPASALKFARRMRDAAPAEDERAQAKSALLLTASLCASGEWVEARRECPGATAAASLGTADRLRLGRLCVELERWDELNRLLLGMGELPDAQSLERDYLRGVWLAANGQSAESVAVLDFVLERSGSNYDAHVWRGVALLRARQPQAARHTLSKAAAMNPGRPAAWYWLAMVEINEGNEVEGGRYLHNALAASAKFAPAWQGLAAIAINANDMTTACEHARQAVEIDAGRAESHFLLAVCLARQGRRDDARAALVRAVELDPSMADRATKTDALAGLID